MKLWDDSYNVKLVETVTVSEHGKSWKVRRVITDDGVTYKKKSLNSFNAFSFETVDNQDEINEYEKLFNHSS
jgi:hypothetical protein